MLAYTADGYCSHVSTWWLRKGDLTAGPVYGSPFLQETNRDHYSQFVTENFAAYCKRKRRDRVYGNNLEIQALSEMYNRPIQVFCYGTGVTHSRGSYRCPSWLLTDEPEGDTSYILNELQLRTVIVATLKHPPLHPFSLFRVWTASARLLSGRPETTYPVAPLVFHPTHFPHGAVWSFKRQALLRSAEPMNIFHAAYATDNPPIRLSYHRGNHYNSLVDPRNTAVGVGLGFAHLRGRVWLRRLPSFTALKSPFQNIVLSPSLGWWQF